MRRQTARVAPILATCLAGLLAVLPAAVSAQQGIGVVASLDPDLTGQAPGAALRRLSVGAGVVGNDTISTSATGRGQLLFQDRSTLSIAPNSSVVLDRFVYDPQAGRGEIGLRVTRGTLRFIGGLATRRSAGEIVTPTATIAVRGSGALIRVVDGRSIAVFLSGQRLCLRPAGGAEVCTNRRGGVLDETGYLGEVSDDFLRALLEDIDGPPPETLQRRGGGGAVDVPEGGPFGSDGSVREEDILDDRFETDTDSGFVFPPLGEMPPDDATGSMMPPGGGGNDFPDDDHEDDRDDDYDDDYENADCYFDGEGTFCPGIGYVDLD